MTKVTITKPGFGVLAYYASLQAAPVSLSLKFRYNEQRAQATLCLLQSSTILQGFDGTETFIILQYNAENLVPGAISLTPVAFHQGLSGIARSAKPKLHRLSLKLTRCYPIWRPLTGSIASKPGFEDRFQHFATLAKATELHIVLDYAWLRPECLATFQRLVAHPEQLSGYPISQFYTRHFRPEEAFSNDLLAPVAAALESDATNKEEAQPPLDIAASSKPVLPDLLSAPLSPSSSQSASSQTSTPPAPKALSVLGTILTKRVVLGLKRELESIHNQTLSHAESLRSTADAEFYEELEELRLELVQAQGDLVADLNRIGDDTLNEFKERCEVEEEEAGDRLLRRILTVYDRLNEKV
ncbi:hypothetical protein CC80DRAFT_452145, partial [Byssothecium circinans]